MAVFDSTDVVGRRKKLAAAVRKAHGGREVGAIVVCASFEEERRRFRQNSYFFYLFGIAEPAAVGVISLTGEAILYLPDFGGARGQWVDEQITLVSSPALFGLQAIKPLGDIQKGYSSSPVFSEGAYKHLITDLKVVQGANGVLSQVSGDSAGDMAGLNLLSFVRNIVMPDGRFYNAAPLVDSLRRVKNDRELKSIRQAIAITQSAHYAAAKVLRPGLRECELQAVIEGEFIRHGALLPAFPSIVGGGVKSTVLHYIDNNRVLEAGDLVVVDIGAEYEYYAADLTRTYPVGGHYSTRQREIYELVLAAQQHAAQIAKPGMFLRNMAVSEQSLHWNVVEFFKQQGLEKYFPHGLGHYLGLDVHDVGSFLEPLQEGDVFTIEPGLYLRDEAIGVRIEDDYLMTQAGAECLSVALPKLVSDIEVAMER